MIPLYVAETRDISVDVLYMNYGLLYYYNNTSCRRGRKVDARNVFTSKIVEIFRRNVIYYYFVLHVRILTACFFF